ncbi:MAG: rhodanese-like domain-containing protein [Bacteroidota bacterium]
MKINYFRTKVSRIIFRGMTIAMMLTVFPLIPSACAQSKTKMVESSAYDLTLKGLLSHSVKEVSVYEIETPSSYQLLDTREKNEFEVSHIEGANWIGYDDFDMERIESLDLDKDQPVLLYCSVGYRSEKIGEKLKAAGYKNVQNLYGGIFEWTNAGKPLVNKEGQPTKKVHAFDKVWGVWVTKGEKVYR